MIDHNKNLEQINYSEKTERSIKEFNNWIFGISIGICSLLIFQINGFDFSRYSCAKILYKTIVLYSMITIFFTGYSKYLILKRENKMNIKYGVLLKLLILKEKKKPEDFNKEWGKTFDDWVTEHNKIKSVAQTLNISIILTSILVFLSAILILILM